MIESLITSKTRVKLLLKFFLNFQTTSYLRGLEAEFGDSSNSIRVELNKLEKAGLLNSTTEGNKKFFFANTSHPLFDDIHNILKKFIGIDQIIEQLISNMGNLHSAYLVGDIALGKDSPTINMVFVGDQLNREYLDSLIQKSKKYFTRPIQYLILTRDEMIRNFSKKPVLLIWKKDPS